MDLISRARLYLEKLDKAVSGSGGHDATFRAACVLVSGFALDRESALSLLREWNLSHCEPAWSESELAHKIDSAIASQSQKSDGYLVSDTKGYRPLCSYAASSAMQDIQPAWPNPDHEEILSLLNTRYHSLQELENYSPLSPRKLTNSYSIVERLFASEKERDPWLCVARDIWNPTTRRLSDLRNDVARARFIVPNRMTGPVGETKHGKPSVRSLKNTGRRRFLVVECDFTPEKNGPLFDWLNLHSSSVSDLCATVLIALAEYAPMVMAVHSGGKSLHGWFSVLDRDESDLRKFMRFACMIGADKATLVPCQMVRLPWGIRDNGNRQSVHYFDDDSTLLRD